jgi:hypothetical protein
MAKAKMDLSAFVGKLLRGARRGHAAGRDQGPGAFECEHVGNALAGTTATAPERCHPDGDRVNCELRSGWRPDVHRHDDVARTAICHR